MMRRRDANPVTQEPIPPLTADQERRAARLFDEAIGFHGRGLLDNAETLYRLILEEHPDHFGSLHLLGVIHAQRGEHEAALREIDTALRINGNDADALNNRGIALKELHRREEALAAYEQAIAINP